jgi:hypothetical protein
MKKFLIILNVALVISIITLSVLIYDKYNKSPIEYIDSYKNDKFHIITCLNDNNKYEIKTDKNFIINEVKKITNNSAQIISNSFDEYKFFEAYYYEVLGTSYTCEVDL